MLGGPVLARSLGPGCESQRTRSYPARLGCDSASPQAPRAARPGWRSTETIQVAPTHLKHDRAYSLMASLTPAKMDLLPLEESGTPDESRQQFSSVSTAQSPQVKMLEAGAWAASVACAARRMQASISASVIRQHLR